MHNHAAKTHETATATKSGKSTRSGGFWITVKHDDGSWRHVFLQGVRGRESKAQRAANDNLIHHGAGGGKHGESQVKAHRAGTSNAPRQSPQQRDHASKLDFLSGGQIHGKAKGDKAGPKARAKVETKAAPAKASLRETVAKHRESQGAARTERVLTKVKDRLETAKESRGPINQPRILERPRPGMKPHAKAENQANRDAAALKIKRARAVVAGHDPATRAKLAEQTARAEKRRTAQGRLPFDAAPAKPPGPTLREQAAAHRAKGGRKGIAPERRAVNAQAVRDARSQTARLKAEAASRLRPAKEAFLGFAPKPGDTRERNAFGKLAGFGEAKRAYHADKEAPRPLPPPRRPSSVPSRHATLAADVVAHQRLSSRLETGRYQRKPAVPIGPRPARAERETALRRRLDERVKAAEKLVSGQKAGGFFKDSALGKASPEKLAEERAKAIGDRQRAERVLAGKAKPTLREAVAAHMRPSR